ncbi:hypothetical protein GCM10011586_07060 [Silvibacterium dinghuense]|nr:hypothetical protein GCM10011586_07060 [Silvibacterium dinghuense]
MLDRQSRRAARDGNASRLTIHCEDIRCFTPAADYDLVTTHFCLDCLSTTEIEALARRLRLRMAPGACWIVSDFALPGGAARIPARIVVRSLYLAFRVITGLQTRTLPDHAEALRNAGFVLLDRCTWLAGLLMSERWTTPAGASTKPLTY